MRFKVSRLGLTLWLSFGAILWMVAFVSVRANGAAPADVTVKKSAVARNLSGPLPVGRAAAPQAASAQSGFAPTGDKACLECHESESVTLVLKTPHAVRGDARTPFAQHQCESCHGASPDHIADPSSKSTALPFSGPNKASVEARNAMCLTCHDNGLRLNWKGSQHERNEVACTNCHTVHANKDPALVRTMQPQKCFTCHGEQRAQANRASHHPIIEGKVICADCHNPHGSPQEKMLVKARVTDLCYKCHPDKRGPFLGEHAPVREDCTLCHTPHGSTQARLLKERPPYLCQECHDTSHHSGSPYGGETYIGGRAPQVQVSGRGCLNCHSQVHGSNSPSGAFNLR
jgi:DmsE family decaheme c-type cytochrome